MRFGFTACAVLALAACEPKIPESGAGFEDYSDYERARIERERALQGEPVETGVISPETTEAESEGASTAAATLAVLGASDPEEVDPNDPNRPRATSPTGISDEQEFEAVSSRRTIEDDKEHLERTSSQYKQIEPTALPARAGGGSGSLVVDFALETTNAVGEQQYKRSGIMAQSRFDRNCAKAVSSDHAQEIFLNAGGPSRDPKGMDPDGDGFACFWDPQPYRNARGG